MPARFVKSQKPLLGVLALFLLALSLADAQTPEIIQPPPLGKLVDVGGYRVHLYCVGSGRPTVVILGAGFSFDWGLVQPEVAKFTRVCAYDHSGIAWSDSGPQDSCRLRVNEAHMALKNAGVEGPYVLVGQSLGAVVARLYADNYPDEAAGMVIVDHALMFFVTPPGSTKLPLAPPSPPEKALQMAPSLPSPDPVYAKLPPRDYQLHLWATALPGATKSLQSTMAAAPECLSQADETVQKREHPLGEKPLVVIGQSSAGLEMGGMSDRYSKLQSQLLSLSQNSKQLVAENSGHIVHVERPDVVIGAIKQVVEAVKSHARLTN